jgi:alanyl-tRNA synthetase
MAADIFASGPLERVKKGSEGTRFLGYGPVPEKEDGTYEWEPGVSGASEVVEIVVGEKYADRLEPGQEGALVLRETPFYAEQGGQVGDTGEIRGPGGALFRVADTKKIEGFHLHLGRLEGGPLARGVRVEAVVDRERRDAIRRNHTGTHLLHRVLKLVLGEDARQAGSLVAPDRLRFDFTWPRPLSPEERERVEAEVNRRIRDDRALLTRVFDAAAAKATGAVSMFGEKYGDRIRVLTAGDSMEYCGGTHCRRTGDIEAFRIAAEKSIGSGVRRIEAVTGHEPVRALEEERSRAAEEERRREGERRARKAVGALKTDVTLDPLAAPRRRAGPVEFVVIEGDGLPESALLGAGDRVKADGGGPLAVLMASRHPEGVDLVAAGNASAVKAGFKAGAAVKAAAEAVGGGGGGRPDLARGKGRDPARLPEAVKAFEAYLAGL